MTGFKLQTSSVRRDFSNNRATNSALNVTLVCKNDNVVPSWSTL